MVTNPTNTPIYTLGISAYYHDSAAALLANDKIIAAAQEERFTRKKHDPSFPENAIRFCLTSNRIKITDLSAIVFYDKPLLKFERLLETYLQNAPKGFTSFRQAMPVWLKEKLFLKTTLKKSLAKLFDCPIKQLPKIYFTEHHQSHAASAFFPSPFHNAAVLCLDGVGEWATTSAWHGKDNVLNKLWEIHFPHSLGLLYSAFTYYTGFKVNSGEYKLMGLAPYGEPKYTKLIYDNLIEVKTDGSFQLNLDYFDYPVGLKMTNHRFDILFGRAPRKPESNITQLDMDLARSIQQVTEDVVLKLAASLQHETKARNLCLAGGVALNCVANGKLQKSGLFHDIFIQPAAGDAGGALGAACSFYHEYLGKKRIPQYPDNMQGSLLGPEYDQTNVLEYLHKVYAKYQKVSDAELFKLIAKLISEENVIGWFQGKMEFGPRALGARSILGDPRSTKMQKMMNLKIKFRESFRPFAPIVKAEKVHEWFDFDSISPYMLMVSQVKSDKLHQPDATLNGLDKLNQIRSIIPAITHVDNSARLQTVDKTTNPRLYKLLDEFEKLTNCPILINTSFNVRSEPIVMNHQDAYQCFMRTEMDYLILGNLVLNKKEQPGWVETKDWQKEYELD